MYLLVYFLKRVPKNKNVVSTLEKKQQRTNTLVLHTHTERADMDGRRERKKKDARNDGSAGVANTHNTTVPESGRD